MEIEPTTWDNKTKNIEIFKYIVPFLKQNNLGEVVNKLENESGIKFYTDVYKYIIESLNKFILDSKELSKNNFNEIIKYVIESIKISSNDNKNVIFLLSILNSLFYEKIYLFYENFTNKELVEDIQNHFSLLNDYLQKFPTFNQIIQTQIDKNRKSIKIILNKDKDGFLFYYPEISSIQSFLDFINEIYNKIYFTSKNEALNNLLNNLYTNSLKTCKYHNIEKLSSEKMKNNINSNNQSIFNMLESHNCNNQINSNIPSKLNLSLDLKFEVQNIVYSSTGKYFAVVLSNQEIITYSMLPMINKENNKKNIEISKIKHFPSTHKGLITSLSWNKTDTLLLTSSKDKTIRIIDPFTGLLKTNFTTIHDAMVSCAVFTDNDTKIASCGMDYRINLTDIKTATKLISQHVPGITINEVLYSEIYNILIVISATNNSIVYYDLEKKCENSKLKMNDVIISSCISKSDNGKFLLINSSKMTPVILLINLKDYKIIGKYFGHRQERFSIKCNFGGYNENFIICGSENGRVYLWSKASSIPISSNKYHVAPVNSAIWPYIYQNDIFISCSDDHYINFISNDRVDKIYFNQGQLQSKNIDFLFKNLNNENPNSNNHTENTENTQTTATRTFNIRGSADILSRLGRILRNIGYASEEES